MKSGRHGLAVRLSRKNDHDSVRLSRTADAVQGVVDHSKTCKLA